MKKKLLALVLTTVLIFTAIPVYAGESGTWNNEGMKPLTVAYGSDGMDYVSLGDSIAYGFGLGEWTGQSGYTKLMTDPESAYQTEVDGAFPILLKDYFKCDSSKFFQGAICSARQQELCYFIESSSVDLDLYYSNLGKYFLPKNGGEPDLARLNNDYANEVSKADFITLSASGNTFMTLLAVAADFWGKPNFELELERYYGSAAVASFNAIKASTLASAKILDKTVKNNEESYVSKVEKLFDILETSLYIFGQNFNETELLLDLIHEKNKDAVIAYIGVPNILSGHKVSLGSFTIDLGKLMEPMTAGFNLAVKNAAAERSSYVRYIDISDVDLCKSEIFGELINLNNISLDSLANAPEVTHPSYEGHKEIAKRILNSFKFKSVGNNYYKIKNWVSNISNILSYKLGLLKLENFVDIFKQINLWGVIKLSILK